MDKVYIAAIAIIILSLTIVAPILLPVFGAIFLAIVIYRYYEGKQNDKRSNF